MELDMNAHKIVNQIALHELAVLLKISDDDMDKCILQVRDEFMKYHDEQISEAIPKIIKNHNIDDVMVGAIIMIFMSDYTCSVAIGGSTNGTQSE